MRLKERYLVIQGSKTMPSTATGRTGGVAVYIGQKEADGTIDCKRPLPHLPFGEMHGRPMYHSPDGFGIGYAGSGPADLALAICGHLGKKHLYQKLKIEFVAQLDRGKDYSIPMNQIGWMLELLEAGKPLPRSK